jgi:hypothetical protein
MILLAFSLAMTPRVWSQTVDDEIKALKEKLATLESQQLELKKEATAAAAALPTFSYRPGNGVSIEAADKSWAFRTELEMYFRYNFLSGRDQIGRSQGELEGRRFRPYFFYCLNNCLWEFEAAIDLDGWGGGNAKNATGEELGSILQRGAVNFDAEQLHPWLPRIQFGMEVQNAQGGSLARQGSSSTGAQAEYDLHTANNGFNTGRAGSGIVLNWDDRSLRSLGIPGSLRRFQLSMSAIAEGDDGLQSFTDRKDFNVYGSVQPFSELKNKWVRGLTFEYGSWFCNVDNRALDNGCSRYRVRDNARGGGRQTLYDTGSGSIGDGLHIAHGPGIVWNIGPYTLRGMGHFQRSEDRGGTTGKKRGNSFLIGHDLFLWSPKGFLTGSATTPGSILIGTHFERVDMSCETAARCADINSGDFHRSRILLREWDLWYFIRPRMSMGINVLWYDASNLRNDLNQEAHDLGVCSTNKIKSGGCRNGTDGDWVDVFLNWRYQF